MPRFDVLLCVLSLAIATQVDTFAQTPRIYRDRVEPHWFANNTHFWYRVALPGGQREFVLVDTGAGIRRPAFDHPKVADALSAATSTNIDAGRLPIDALEFSDDLQSVTLTGSIGEWNLKLNSYKLQKISASDGATVSSRLFLPSRKSVDRGGDVQLEITNQLAFEIQLIWIDRDGNEQSYGSIKPDVTRDQHTFAGHVWLLKTADKRLACFEAFDGHNQINIDVDAIQEMTQRISRKQPQDSKRPQQYGPHGATSPDGQYAAFVKDDNLWIRPSTEGVEAQPRLLSSDAHAAHSFRKDASRARLIEMEYARSDYPDDVPDVRWSPDSRHLLAFQTTIVSERRVHYVESSPGDQLQPKVESYPYAKPGDPIPVPRPRLFAVDDGREIEISNELFPNPFKLQFLKWSDDGRRFWLLYNERGHQALQVLEVTAPGGSVRTIVDERSDTFIHYSTAGKFVLEWLGEDGLIWASERSGWNHLYRYSIADAKVQNAVTAGDWNVRRIERIDSETGVIWFYAVGIVKDQDPYHEHFCRVNIDGSGLTLMTQGDGTHEIAWSPDRQFYFDRYSRVDLPPITELRRTSDGTLVTALETADASEILKSRGHLPQRFFANGRDGETDIWGVIHFPRNFDPDRIYPVVENIYAGPHDHHVPKAFRSRYGHQHQIADRGMIVVQIDGMGTAWRSKKFHDVCFRNLRDAGFPDRIAWLRAAAKKHPSMDLSRVGIYGGSAGGQNAMAALLWHGAFYRVAVADCGCHDNRMDKLWWNEQWMGWPVDDHYAANSNTENAWRLQGKLLLVVGERDRNVDPASTTQVVQALIRSHKDFDFLLIPGVGHGACEQPYASRRRADFLAGHLRAGETSATVDP